MNIPCLALAWFLWKGYFIHIEKYLSIWEFILLSMTCKRLRKFVLLAHPWMLQPRDGESMTQQALEFIGKAKDFQIPMLLSMSLSWKNYRERIIYRFNLFPRVVRPAYLSLPLRSYARKLEAFRFLGLSRLSIERRSWQRLKRLDLEGLFMQDCVFTFKNPYLSFCKFISLKVLYYVPTSTGSLKLFLPNSLRELYVDLSNFLDWAPMVIKMKSCDLLEKV